MVCSLLYSIGGHPTDSPKSVTKTNLNFWNLDLHTNIRLPWTQHSNFGQEKSHLATTSQNFTQSNRNIFICCIYWANKIIKRSFAAWVVHGQKCFRSTIFRTLAIIYSIVYGLFWVWSTCMEREQVALQHISLSQYLLPCSFRYSSPKLDEKWGWTTYSPKNKVFIHFRALVGSDAILRDFWAPAPASLGPFAVPLARENNRSHTTAPITSQTNKCSAIRDKLQTQQQY